MPKMNPFFGVLGRGSPTSRDSLPSFAAVQQAVAQDVYDLGIDYTVANQLSLRLYGRTYALASGLVSWVPYLLIAAVLVTALISKNYWLMTAAPTILAGEFFSNPHWPFRSFASLTGLLAAGLAVWQANAGLVVGTGIFGGYAIAFWTNRAYYRVNRSKLERAALASEDLFVSLFSLGKLGIRNRQTGAMFWRHNVPGIL